MIRHTKFAMAVVTVLAVIVSFLNHENAFGDTELDILWSVNPQQGSVDALDFSDDGRYLVTGIGSNAFIWDALSGAVLDSFNVGNNNVVSVDFSPDRVRLGIGYVTVNYPQGGLTEVWDYVNGNYLFQVGGAIVSFSPDGQYVASAGGGFNRYLYVTRVSDRFELFGVWTGSYVTDVAFSPDGSVVAVSGTDRMVKFYDARAGNLIQRITAHDNQISTIAFSPDGRVLATGSNGTDQPYDPTIRFWNVYDGSLISFIDAFDERVYDVKFSPDGRTLLSSGRDANLSAFVLRLKLWDVSSGNRVYTHDAGAYTVGYSPDGGYFAYGSPYGDLVVAYNPIDVPDAAVFMAPDNQPVEVGRNQSFTYSGIVHSLIHQSRNLDVWVMLGLPMGTRYGPIERYSNFPLNPLQKLRIDGISQMVPAYAPYGQYNYLAFVGSYPYAVDSAEFPFTVVQGSLSGQNQSGWNLYGWFENGNDAATIPGKPIISANYPNPFNAVTTITFDLARSGNTSLEIFNLAGQKVETLLDGNIEAGRHEIRWDASRYASGVYFYKITADGEQLVQRMTLLK